MKGNSRREKKGDRLELLANVGRINAAGMGSGFMDTLRIPGCGTSYNWIRIYKHIVCVRRSPILVIIDRKRGNTLFVRPRRFDRLRIDANNYDCFLVDSTGAVKREKEINTDVSRKAIKG